MTRTGDGIAVVGAVVGGVADVEEFVGAAGIADEAWPGTFREYQLDALARLDECRQTGRRRAWLVLPPGAGKTLVGLEAARRRGGRVVVFVPTTAIQGQWVRAWQQFTPQRV
ncbi:MAG TPA: DEAD/DEAH box helicase family protein, partial [Actinocrinis sp.]|uniref:DEAD/DEAH box helicase family protein n=1 Tax=Actinocrinis sp. TaxID=1920516 RepID=UPI002DDD6612